ncbi:MAG: Helix-turn-helix domain [Solirubrobacterales bacterium]|nr:Helix-turn-helix domain [Solirubrobacterales bacterium]
MGLGARGASEWLSAVADPTRVHILRVLSQLGAATAADLAAEASASHQTLRRHLDALVATGVLREHPGESDGQTPGRPAARFSLGPEWSESIRQLFRSAG